MTSVRLTLEMPDYFGPLIAEMQKLDGDPVDVAGFIDEAIVGTIDANIEYFYHEEPEKGMDLIRRFHLEEKYGYLLKEPKEQMISERDREPLEKLLLDLALDVWKKTVKGEQFTDDDFTNWLNERGNPQPVEETNRPKSVPMEDMVLDIIKSDGFQKRLDALKGAEA